MNYVLENMYICCLRYHGGSREQKRANMKMLLIRPVYLVRLYDLGFVQACSLLRFSADADIK
jgi:hypothetical protein